MTIRPFLHLPPPASLASFASVESYLRRMLEALQNARRGKLECVVDLTLTADATTTVFTDPRLSPQSAVFFDPMTATAATAIYGGGMYVLEADRGKGAWTVTHASTADADKTFRAIILG